MTVAKYLACALTWALANVAHAQPLIPPTAIDWLLDCTLNTTESLDPAVLERTQCGVVAVPRDYAAPHQGTLDLYLTRVGARQPLSREGLVFAQAGETPDTKTDGTFAIQLANRWRAYGSQAYRTLLNHYDLIELSPRDLTEEREVDNAARDMEFVRTQLGDNQLHFVGNADATRVGSRYAALFPERMVRMVLVDGEPADTAAVHVDQLRLRDGSQPGARGCISKWVGDFLAYGKQPPPTARCLDMAEQD